jgi:hypothetical protein
MEETISKSFHWLIKKIHSLVVQKTKNFKFNTNKRNFSYFHLQNFEIKNSFFAQNFANENKKKFINYQIIN